MSCGTTLETTPEPAPPASADPQPSEPVDLGTAPSAVAPDPVDLAPADLGVADPVGAAAPTDEPPAWEPPSEPVSAPSWSDGPSDPVSAPEPTSYDLPAASSPEPMVPEPPAPSTWGAPVSGPPPTTPAWTPPVTSAPEPAPAPTAWQPPAATPPPAAQPAWSAPAPAPAAPTPAPQPMPPPPNPSPGDPFALGAASQRLDQGAQAAARTALVATAAVMVQGERVEAVTVGRLDAASAVLTLTDRRVLAVNQRDWSPVVTWFPIDPQLDVQAWEDQSGATIVLTAAGRQITLDSVTDKQPAYELVARLRARLGR
jgi:hypothetical protein